ncbi:MAG: 50S ribosomal protein L6, partial [Clostridia bacterium]|nr:50S ribosomal protein L6 [Clostridia bacterium]
MSRIGKRPIPVPAGVKVEVDDKNLVTVKGPKGTLQQQVDPQVKIEQQGQELILTIEDDRIMGAKHGLYRALLHNMV